MFKDKYVTKPLFEYAMDYCMVFPKGLENKYNVGNGSLLVEKDYLIYFKPNTPEDIKEWFIKDYAEYYKKKKIEGIYDG